MSPQDFNSLLKKASTAARNLNRESDELSNIIDDFEEKLAAMNFGLEVWLGKPLEELGVAIDEEGEPVEGDFREVELGYARGLNQQWRLQLRTVRYRQNDDTGSVDLCETEAMDPLASASRSRRIRAVELFPNLLEQLVEEAERATEIIRQARATTK